MAPLNRIIMATAAVLCVTVAIMCTYRTPDTPKASSPPNEIPLMTVAPTPKVTPAPTPTPTPQPTPTPEPTPEALHYTQDDVETMANIIYHEARGIAADVELACVAWTICNRVDAGFGDLQEVMTERHQFAYDRDADFSAEPEAYARALTIAEDVLQRWNREQNGEHDVGRVLPRGYLYFQGDGKHNYFRKRYEQGQEWDYSLPDVYREAP